MTAFFRPSEINIDAFETLCAQSACLEEYPDADRVAQNVLIYEGSHIREVLKDEAREEAFRTELHRALQTGPGVFVIRSMYPDVGVIDRSTELFKEIILEEKALGYGQGDHFGSNERIWNALQKVCLRDPELFVAYYGNPILACVSLAWLGPFYQVTAQVNNVKPGGPAQAPHRDYHLGFQSSADIARFPGCIQEASQYLTLQGAVAHTDMELESGPTYLLPFSQQYAQGYMAYSRPEFVSFFNDHHVQLPLNRGDAVFFNPALFHSAGTNRSKHDRIANLLQISSAFGRPMEALNRDAMMGAVYPLLRKGQENGTLSDRLLRDIIAVVADGYAFPTNLDTDPPLDGHAPGTAQQLLHRAVTETWSQKEVQRAIGMYTIRRKG